MNEASCLVFDNGTLTSALCFLYSDGVEVGNRL